MADKLEFDNLSQGNVIEVKNVNAILTEQK